MRIVLIIISPIIFFYDLLASKFSNKHIISNRTYLLMRYLYKYFGGFFIQFISYFLSGIKSKLPSNFSKTFSRHKVIDRLECEKISKAILRTSIINKPIADQKLKLNLNQNDLDFEYYQKKNLIRLDFSSQELVKNKTISSFATNTYWSKEIKKILGTRPYFVGIDAWLTLPPLNMMDKYDDIGNFVSSQMWHRDCDKLRDIKVMTYLTDVPSENDGPFEIVQGTNKLNFFHPKII